MTYPEVLWFYIVWALEREWGDNLSDAGERAGSLQGQLFKHERLTPSASPWLHPDVYGTGSDPSNRKPSNFMWPMISLEELFLWGLSQKTIYRRSSSLFPPSGCLKKWRKAETIIPIWKSHTWLYGGNPRLQLWRQKRPFLWHPPGGTRSPIYSAHSRGHSWRQALEGRGRKKRLWLWVVGGETDGYRYMHWHENRFKVNVTSPKQESSHKQCSAGGQEEGGVGRWVAGAQEPRAGSAECSG